MNQVLLVDGHNIALRSMHAAHGSMSTEAGYPTGGPVIFAGMLGKVVKDLQPTHVRICWDTGRSFFRTALYPGYKAKREVPSEPKEEYLSDVRNLAALMNFPSLSYPGVEADDLIAASVRTAWETLDEPEVTILSGDKDLLQLLRYGSRVTQIRPGCDPELWGPKEVIDKYDWVPSLLPYYFALVGDVGDGVPGVRGIGPKKAALLLAQGCCDWEATLALLSPTQAAEAVLSYRLVNLLGEQHIAEMEDVSSAHEPLERWEPTGPGTALWSDLHALLGRWEMDRLASRLVDGSHWGWSPLPVASLTLGE